MYFGPRLPLLLLAAGLAGCGLWGRGTQPADMPDVAMRSCGVAFDGRAQEARFSIDLTAVRPLPAGSVVEVAFEDPLGAATPLTAVRVVKGGERVLTLRSPPVKGIEPREYAMAVRVYDADRRRLLGARTERCAVPVGQLDAGIEFR